MLTARASRSRPAWRARSAATSGPRNGASAARTPELPRHDRHLHPGGERAVVLARPPQVEPAGRVGRLGQPCLPGGVVEIGHGAGAEIGEQCGGRRPQRELLVRVPGVHPLRPPAHSPAAEHVLLDLAGCVHRQIGRRSRRRAAPCSWPSPSAPTRSARPGASSAPGATTTKAMPTSPSRSSGMPTTATWPTAGWPSRRFSISAGYALKPPTMNMSFLRPTMRRQPRSSSVPRSPVCSQPSASIASRGLVRVVEVAPHHAVAAHQHLARLPHRSRWRRRRRRCGPRGRVGLARPSWRSWSKSSSGAVAVDRARLGQAVAGDDRLERQLVVHAPDQLDGDVGRAGDRDPQRRQVEAIAVRMVEDRLVDRGRSGQHRHRLRGDRPQHVVDVEDGLRDDRRAPHERGEAAGLVAEHVEERVHDQVPVTRRRGRPCRTSRRTARSVWAWVISTPFGAPVVPDVNSTSLTSSPRTALPMRASTALLSTGRPSARTRRVSDRRLRGLVEADDDVEARAGRARRSAMVAA